MATMAEMMVTMGADTSDFQREVSQMERSFSRMTRELSSGTRGISQSFQNMSPEVQQSFSRMQEAMQENRQKMQAFKGKQMEVKAAFYDMTLAAKDFTGSNEDFIASLTELGGQQKKITEEMMANNDMARSSFYQTVGTLLSASSQASKIEKQYDSLGNPLYQVNDAFLQMADNLNGVAAAGAPAVVALRMLGPTANMHQLQQQTMLIQQGLMRYQMVSMATLAVVGLMFAGLSARAAEAVPGYKDAMDKMGAAVGRAFQPMVEVFAAVMMKIAEFVTWVAELITKFNEAHPLLAKVIQGFLMLIPVLALILAPMSIGIGMFNGMAVAFNSLWMMIGPLITGLSAMMGTVLLVAGVIAILIGVFVYLWKTNEGFRAYIINAWNQIKAAAIAAWNYIYNSVIVPVVNSIVSFVKQLFGQLKSWWNTNSNQIKQIASVVWRFIKVYIITEITILVAVLKTLWNIIKSVIQAVWGNIKSIISAALNIILNIISVFVNIFTGNWKGVWNNIKSIVQSAWSILANVIGAGINIVLGLVKGLGDSLGGKFKEIGRNFYNAGKGFIEQMVKGIKSMVGKVLSTIESVAGKVRDFLPFSPAKTGPLSDLDKLDFGGPIEDSISRALPRVQSMMTRMVRMPDIEPNSRLTSSSRSPVDGGTQEYQFTIPLYMEAKEVAKATAKYNQKELDRQREELDRFGGLLSYD